jgi:hypothetical protein
LNLTWLKTGKAAFFKILCCLLILIVQGCSFIHLLYAPEDGIYHPHESGFLSLSGGCPLLLRHASAVIIRPGLAITNQHIISAISSPTARNINGERIPVEKIILSDRYDLALLYIPCDVNGAYPAGRKIRSGEEISALGTSLFHPYFQGIVAMDAFPFVIEVSLYGAAMDNRIGLPVNSGFLYTGATKGGFSGGPIFNKAGELVGMNQGLVTRYASNLQPIGSGSTHGVAYHLEDLLKEVDLLTNGKDHCSQRH